MGCTAVQLGGIMHKHILTLGILLAASPLVSTPVPPKDQIKDHKDRVARRQANTKDGKQTKNPTTHHVPQKQSA